MASDRATWERAWTVEIPYPVGINATYGRGNGRVYLTKRARQWKEDIVIYCRLAGMGTIRGNVKSIDVTCELRHSRMDVDAPSKLLLDTVCKSVLGVDDRLVRTYDLTKGPAIGGRPSVLLTVCVQGSDVQN